VVVMSIRRCLILGWLLAGLQVFSAGQNAPPENQTPQNPPAQTSDGDNGSRAVPAAAVSAIAGMQLEGGTEGDSNSDMPQIPALLGGSGVSSAFISELKRSNYLRGGLNVSAAYDDNPLLASSGAKSNTSISIFPNVSIEESSPRIRWMLGYAGGVTINENLTSENQDAQNLNFDSQYRLSPHVNLRIAENFFLTTGFFDAGNGLGVVGSVGPNTSLITPLATQRSSLTTVETNYHFALNDLIGASGSFYDLNFSNVSAGSLTDSQTASGSAFWLHRIFLGDWGGLSYRFDRITFNPNGETRVSSFNLVNTLSIAKRFTVTAFVGPQYSENQGLVPGATQPTQSNDWSVSFGADGGWRNVRTSISAGYTRSISDGAGVLGVVRLQTVHGNFRREVVPGWAVALNASYGTNQSVTVPFVTSATSIDNTSAGISLEHNVGKSFGFRFGYTHDFQQQFGVSGPTQTLDANRNRVFATLSYQWAKPLGM
jgi:hypothetical protein